MSAFTIKICKKCKQKKVFISAMSASIGICESCRTEEIRKEDKYDK